MTSSPVDMDLFGCSPTEPPPPVFHTPSPPTKRLVSWNVYPDPVPVLRVAPAVPPTPTCPLCRTQRKRLRFCCQQCVNSGRFAHSDLRKPDDLCDKELKLKLVERQMEQLRETVKRREARTIRVAELREKIRSCKQSLKYLRPLVDDKRQRVAKVTKMTASLQGQNEKRLARLPMFQLKVDQISKCSGQHLGDLGRERDKLTGREREVASLRRAKAMELSRYIFTVEEVPPPPPEQGAETPTAAEDEVCLESIISDTIAEAMQTSFIDGKWVMAKSAGTDSSAGEMYYRIVYPTLVGSGDYASVYHAWKNKENQQVRS